MRTGFLARCVWKLLLRLCTLYFTSPQPSIPLTPSNTTTHTPPTGSLCIGVNRRSTGWIYGPPYPPSRKTKPFTVEQLQLPPFIILLVWISKVWFDIDAVLKLLHLEKKKSLCTLSEHPGPYCKSDVLLQRRGKETHIWICSRAKRVNDESMEGTSHKSWLNLVQPLGFSTALNLPVFGLNAAGNTWKIEDGKKKNKKKMFRWFSKLLQSVKTLKSIRIIIFFLHLNDNDDPCKIRTSFFWMNAWQSWSVVMSHFKTFVMSTPSVSHFFVCSSYVISP